MKPITFCFLFLLSPPLVAKDSTRIARYWQNRCSSLIEKSSEKQGWGLFSYSGWVDIGQWCLVGKRLHWVEGGAKQTTPMNVHTISAQELDFVTQQATTWKSTKDFLSHTFDGLQFEYVHWVKDSKKISAQKRIFMNNPKDPPWTDILKIFQNLKPQTSKSSTPPD